MKVGKQPSKQTTRRFADKEKQQQKKSNRTDFMLYTNGWGRILKEPFMDVFNEKENYLISFAKYG